MKKGKDISYAGCGLPYYIGGAIETEGELIVNTPEKFMKLTGTTVHTNSEVIAVNTEEKTVSVRGDGQQEVSYDRLVIAVGAQSIIPPVAGVKLSGVFTVRTPEDAIRIRKEVRGRADAHGKDHQLRRQIPRLCPDTGNPLRTGFLTGNR